MTKFKHLFLLDAFESLNLRLDTSLRLAWALAARGHDVLSTTAAGLSLRRGDPSSRALVTRLTFPGGEIGDCQRTPAGQMELCDFDAIHMRKDPPFDASYLALTWHLDTAGPSTRVYNDPAALRTVNEKLGILRFPEYIRPALYSANPQALADFVREEAGGDAILKPLTLFGGRGILRLQDSPDLTEILRRETADGPRLIQPFDKAIHAGEVRAFTVGGKALAFCLKKPGEGSFLANTSSGATLEPWQPDQATLTMVEDVAGRLYKEGMVFLGFDIIGGHLSEINITSPRLLTGVGDDTDYYQPMAAWVEEDLLRHHSMERKS